MQRGQEEETGEKYKKNNKTIPAGLRYMLACQ